MLYVLINIQISVLTDDVAWFVWFYIFVTCIINMVNNNIITLICILVCTLIDAYNTTVWLFIICKISEISNNNIILINILICTLRPRLSSDFFSQKVKKY